MKFLSTKLKAWLAIITLVSGIVSMPFVFDWYKWNWIYYYGKSNYVPPAFDELARQRNDRLQSGLQLHGAASYFEWRVGAFGIYTNDAHGKPGWNTNTALFWDGAWAENTNGWRVEVNIRDTNQPEMMAIVSVGSLVRNSDEGTGDYFTPPRNYLEKFELKSPDGKILQPKPTYIVEKDCPSRIPVKLYPITQLGFHEGEIWFVTNGPPCPIAYQEFRVYSITNEGDYTLTVRPVLYQNRTGKKIELTKDFHETNTNYFDRVDLPSVTTKVHLKPAP
jgi:hypothetical protein